MLIIQQMTRTAHFRNCVIDGDTIKRIDSDNINSKIEKGWIYDLNELRLQTRDKYYVSYFFKDSSDVSTRLDLENENIHKNLIDAIVIIEETDDGNRKKQVIECRTKLGILPQHGRDELIIVKSIKKDNESNTVYPLEVIRYKVNHIERKETDIYLFCERL